MSDSGHKNVNGESNEIPEAQIGEDAASSQGLIKKALDILGPLIGLAIVFALFSFLEPNTFLTGRNLGNVAGQILVVAITAVGMTFVIVSGGIDLSVGSLIALSGTTGTMAIAKTGSVTAGVLVAVLTGVGCGTFNGAMITGFRLPPFIVTLGTLEIFRGLALELTDGMQVTNLPEHFSNLANAELSIPLFVIPYSFMFLFLAPFIVTFGKLEIFRSLIQELIEAQRISNLPEYLSNPENAELPITFLVIPYSFMFLILFATLAWLVLRKTVFGYGVYAIGSNEQTARLCGLRVNWMKVSVYAIGGLATGIAGIMQMSRLITGQPTAAIGRELDVIAAVVIGGGNLLGGEGTILGSLIGAAIMGFLRNGCNLVGISPYVQRIVIGSIIIVAVLADLLRHRSFGARRGG